VLFPKAYLLVDSQSTRNVGNSDTLRLVRDFQLIFPRHFGFTGKKHLPMLGITGPTYYPHTFLANFWRMRQWRIVDYNSGYMRVEKASPSEAKLPHSISLRLEEHWFDTFFCEWPYWTKWYLPDFDLAGRTVLDAGAGCGESAAFFFENRAHTVIGVEPNPSAVDCLRENAKVNGWRLEIVPIEFYLF
jgi:hypothetical protein